ncbi:hypothetical protein A8C32_11965 [Flavivirga aquatica]|uniref:Uncharacterized protein n=1 Tax=Flavivirga aquatica TaxID=1849968 RepID=A0A1E5TDL2_9FLAO|nr:hypothetical protein [Flavivirga aquatica]OEK09427.1 hypothetical protein A8C32_11965 [Flavivirga aquatica]
MTVYLISNQEFEGKVRLKAFDVAKKEIGRSFKTIKMAEDEALYFDFEFDNRTPLLQANFFEINIK